MNDGMYYLLIDSQETGPFSLGQIGQMLANQEVTEETLYSQPGSAKWLPLSTIHNVIALHVLHQKGGSESAQPGPTFKVLRSRTRRNGLPPMAALGVFLLLLGLMSAGFVLHHFDPSVPGRGFFRIINIGLLQERQNWLILSLAVAVIGAVFAAVGWRKH